MAAYTSLQTSSPQVMYVPIRPPSPTPRPSAKNQEPLSPKLAASSLKVNNRLAFWEESAPVLVFSLGPEQ